MAEMAIKLTNESISVVENKKLKFILEKISEIHENRKEDENAKAMSSYLVYSVYDVYSVGW